MDDLLAMIIRCKSFIDVSSASIGEIQHAIELKAYCLMPCMLKSLVNC